MRRWAKEKLGYRCLKQTVRPTVSDDNRAKRRKMARSVVGDEVPTKKHLHQDEKWFKVNTRRRLRKVRKSDKAGAKKVIYTHSRNHNTKVMFTGTAGVGPDGKPIKLHFKWVCKKRISKRKSKYHEKHDVYYESTTMNSEYYKKTLHEIGKAIRRKWTELGYATSRVKLQIDSAGGHGLARGHGRFEELASMMHENYNVELVQQPGNSPMFYILDLAVWKSTEKFVDKMDTGERQREPELVKTVKKAWRQLPPVKILEAFEMRRDVAHETLETNGWCPNEGKGRGGAKRVHEDSAYAELRD